MEPIDEIKKEVIELRKEVEAFKKREKAKDRLITRLSKQLNSATKQIKTLKVSSRNNANAIDALRSAFRNAFRNMGR